MASTDNTTNNVNDGDGDGSGGGGGKPDSEE